jgi:hypothetical protein
MDLDGPRWTSAAPTSLTLTILADVSVLNVSSSVGGLLASDQMSKESSHNCNVPRRNQKHQSNTTATRLSGVNPKHGHQRSFSSSSDKYLFDFPILHAGNLTAHYITITTQNMFFNSHLIHSQSFEKKREIWAERAHVQLSRLSVL